LITCQHGTQLAAGKIERPAGVAAADMLNCSGSDARVALAGILEGGVLAELKFKLPLGIGIALTAAH